MLDCHSFRQWRYQLRSIKLDKAGQALDSCVRCLTTQLSDLRACHNDRKNGKVDGARQSALRDHALGPLRGCAWRLTCSRCAAVTNCYTAQLRSTSQLLFVGSCATSFDDPYLSTARMLCPTHMLQTAQWASELPCSRANDRMPCQPSSSGRKHAPLSKCGAAQSVTEAAPVAVSGKNFIRSHLLNMEPYTPILPFEILSKQMGMDPHDIVKLDANENPYGPPPEVLEALGNMQFPNIYPDPETRRLRAALSKLNNIPMENLLVGQSLV